MPKNIPRTGKRQRPKTAVKGKRYLLCEVPATQPKAREDAGTVVLLVLSGSAVLVLLYPTWKK